MIVFDVRNVHQALPTAINHLRQHGFVRDSRNGRVVRLSQSVATTYSQPMERVEFHAWRDSNPFFNFYESLWMLAGRHDVRPLTRYVKRMSEFSDDGVTQNAAYGYRWRHARDDQDSTRGSDQLKIICDGLRRDPNSRQYVLQIWDHVLDLGTVTKDHACNVVATFQIFDDSLDMVVFCRSNDVIWGAYGSNAVHFSMLLEYVARRVGVRVGTYTQISVNFHAYVDLFRLMMPGAESWDQSNPYVDGRFMDPNTPVTTHPIAMPGEDFDEWDRQCASFVSLDGCLPEVERNVFSPFFSEVAWPIVQAHDVYKAGSVEEAIAVLEECRAQDWRMACQEWLKRRRERKLRREANEGVGR